MNSEMNHCLVHYWHTFSESDIQLFRIMINYEMYKFSKLKLYYHSLASMLKRRIEQYQGLDIIFRMTKRDEINSQYNIFLQDPIVEEIKNFKKQ